MSLGLFPGLDSVYQMKGCEQTKKEETKDNQGRWRMNKQRHVTWQMWGWRLRPETVIIGVQSIWHQRQKKLPTLGTRSLSSTDIVDFWLL